MSAGAEQAAAIVRRRCPGFAPRLAVVLGSGLGAVAERMPDHTAIAYGELPGFPAPSVAGHAGTMLLGEIGGLPVALLQGRAHYYERGQADAMRVAIETLAAIGCPALLLTCAAGSLRAEVGPGSLMAVADHINFAGVSPLTGESGPRRFVDMTDAYDAKTRAELHVAAHRAGLSLTEGVYAWFAGPQFETPAEIRAARSLGADAVGMSVVPETILARHAGLKVAAIAVITNLGAGMAASALHHEQTLRNAGRAKEDLARLLETFVRQMKSAG